MYGQPSSPNKLGQLGVFLYGFGIITAQNPEGARWHHLARLLRWPITLQDLVHLAYLQSEPYNIRHYFRQPFT